jgi:hypothetical protein
MFMLQSCAVVNVVLASKMFATVCPYCNHLVLQGKGKICTAVF